MVWVIGSFGGTRGSCDWRTIKYLNWIAKKHNLDTQKFLASIIRAWAKGVSRCEKLRIQCLIKAEDYPRFRVTEAERLITQTKVNLKLLKDVAMGRVIVTGEFRRAGKHRFQ